MNQFNIIKICTIFTQQQDTNSIQVPIDYKPRSNSSFHVTINQEIIHVPIHYKPRNTGIYPRT